MAVAEVVEVEVGLAGNPGDSAVQDAYEAGLIGEATIEAYTAYLASGPLSVLQTYVQEQMDNVITPAVAQVAADAEQVAADAAQVATDASQVASDKASVSSMKNDTEGYALAAQLASEVIYETLPEGNADVLDDEQFAVKAYDGDGYFVYQRVDADPDNAVFVTWVGGNAIGFDAPFPGLPAQFLEWTPRIAWVDNAGNIIRIQCDEGTISASNGTYVEGEPWLTGAVPIPQRFDSQSVSGVLPVVNGNSSLISIAGLKRPDNNFLTATIDGEFGHSNINAPATGDTVTIAGSWVETGRAWKVYANNRLAMFPPGTDLGVIWLGQSWSNGGNDMNPMTTALSTVSLFPGKCIMPAAGIRIPNYLDGELGSKAIRFWSFANHVETSGNAIGTVMESPAAGCANHLMTNIEYYFGTSHGLRIFSAVCAHGGYAMEELCRGNAMFEDILVKCITDYVRTSRAQGKTPLILAFPMTHGQANDGVGTDPAQYALYIEIFHRRLCEIVRKLLPWQTFEPVLVIDQLRSARSTFNSFNQIAKAQWIVTNRNRGIVMMGPQYMTPGAVRNGVSGPLPNETGGSGHPTPLGYHDIGQMAAEAILYSPPIGMGWNCLGPDTEWENGGVRWDSESSFTIQYRRPRGMGTLAATLDSSRVILGPACSALNWGFEYFDSTGNTNLAPSRSIVSCTITAVNRIKFQLDGAPQGWGRKIICGGRTDGPDEDSMHGGGRCLVYLDDGDTRFHTSIQPVPVSEGGDGLTHRVNYPRMIRHELALGG